MNKDYIKVVNESKGGSWKDRTKTYNSYRSKELEGIWKNLECALKNTFNLSDDEVDKLNVKLNCELSAGDVLYLYTENKEMDYEIYRRRYGHMIKLYMKEWKFVNDLSEEQKYCLIKLLRFTDFEIFMCMYKYAVYYDKHMDILYNIYTYIED